MLWGQSTCVFHKATVVSRLVSTWTTTLQLLCTLPLGCEHLCVCVCVCVCGGRFHVSRDILACRNRRSTSVINQINDGWIAFMSSSCVDLSDWHGLLESCNYCFYEYDSVFVSTLNIQPPFYSPFLPVLFLPWSGGFTSLLPPFP